jgi:ABC-2 type transport system permease protein
MSSLLHVAIHDLRQHVADRANIFYMLLMPLGFVAFFTLVNSGSGTQAEVQVSLPIVNEDQGILGTTFTEYLQDESFAAPVYSAAEAETTSFDARYLHIPKIFSDSVIAGVPTSLELVKRERSNLDYDLTAEVHLHQAQVRMLGDLARWSATRDTTQAADPTSPAELGRLIALAEEPLNVTVRSGFAGRGRPVPSGTGQSIPGVMVMFVVMSVLIGGSASLTAERDAGTLRRLATTPLTARQIIAGKTLGLTFLGLVQAMILIGASELIARIPQLHADFTWLPYLPALLPLLIVYCACIAALTLFASAMLRTPQQAESLAWLIGMVLSGLGGAWWPLEIVPRSMRLVGQFFPTAWAMEGLHQVITWGHGIAGTGMPVLVLALMTSLFWWLGARSLRIAR